MRVEDLAVDPPINPFEEIDIGPFIKRLKPDDLEELAKVLPKLTPTVLKRIPQEVKQKFTIEHWKTIVKGYMTVAEKQDLELIPKELLIPEVLAHLRPFQLSQYYKDNPLSDEDLHKILSELSSSSTHENPDAETRGALVAHLAERKSALVARLPEMQKMEEELMGLARPSAGPDSATILGACVDQVIAYVEKALSYEHEGKKVIKNCDLLAHTYSGGNYEPLIPLSPHILKLTETDEGLTVLTSILKKLGDSAIKTQNDIKALINSIEDRIRINSYKSSSEMPRKEKAD